MDHFEGIIATLLEADGYWVRRAFKVNLSKEEKRQIGKPSIPRPEIDLLAFKPGENKILVLEAKSFLDSPGVRLSELQAQNAVPEGRYKLFTTPNYRSIVFHRLHQDLIAAGMAQPHTQLQLGLAAGKVYQDATATPQIAHWMAGQGWCFWSPDIIKDKVIALTQQGYDNNPAIITAKILLK